MAHPTGSRPGLTQDSDSEQTERTQSRVAPASGSLGRLVCRDSVSHPWRCRDPLRACRCARGREVACSVSLRNGITRDRRMTSARVWQQRLSQIDRQTSGQFWRHATDQGVQNHRLVLACAVCPGHSNCDGFRQGIIICCTSGDCSCESIELRTGSRQIQVIVVDDITPIHLSQQQLPST